MEHSDAIELAKKVSLDAGKVTVSLVQRKLRIGYTYAARLVDELKDVGFCGSEFLDELCGYPVTSKYAQPNEHGAYEPDQCEIVEFKGGLGAATIMLAHISPDEWIFSVRVTLASRFWGGYPAHDRGKRYSCRQDAILAAISGILADCRETRLSSSSSKTEEKARKEVIAWAKTQTQLRMF